MAVQTAFDTVEETWGGPLEALGLAIAVLKKTKARSWEELCSTKLGTPTAKLLASIDLSPGQLSILEAHRDVVALLQLSPNAIPAICNVCGLPTLVDTTVPASCTMSLRCTGKPVKPVAAKKVEQAPTRPPLDIGHTEEPDDAPEELDFSDALEDLEHPEKPAPEPVAPSRNEPAEELVEVDEF